VSTDCLFLCSTELMKASEVNAPTRALKWVETAPEWRLLREGPPRLKQLVVIRGGGKRIYGGSHD
jgi:hypothetical protein